MKKISLLGIVLTIVAVIVFGHLTMHGHLAIPDWALWAMFIASGNLIYTKVWHRDEVETISLVMAFILISIQLLNWPEIAVATVLGVGIGEVFLTNREWYKKLYNIGAITLAGVATEIVYTYANWSVFQSILGTAIVFDLVLYTLLVPIWLLVAKQTVREIHRSYFATLYTVPLAAGLAWIMVNVVEAWGNAGILVMAIVTLVALKPEYTLPDRMTVKCLQPRAAR